MMEQLNRIESKLDKALETSTKNQADLHWVKTGFKWVGTILAGAIVSIITLFVKGPQ
jgi:hypothetical protein